MSGWNLGPFEGGVGAADGGGTSPPCRSGAAQQNPEPREERGAAVEPYPSRGSGSPLSLRPERHERRMRARPAVTSSAVMAGLDPAIHAMTDQQGACASRLCGTSLRAVWLHRHGMDRRLKADDDGAECWGRESSDAAERRSPLSFRGRAAEPGTPSRTRHNRRAIPLTAHSRESGNPHPTHKTGFPRARG
jgi:hypothetical protein